MTNNGKMTDGVFCCSVAGCRSLSVCMVVPCELVVCGVVGGRRDWACPVRFPGKGFAAPCIPAFARDIVGANGTRLLSLSCAVRGVSIGFLGSKTERAGEMKNCSVGEGMRWGRRFFILPLRAFGWFGSFPVGVSSTKGELKNRFVDEGMRWGRRFFVSLLPRSFSLGVGRTDMDVSPLRFCCLEYGIMSVGSWDGSCKMCWIVWLSVFSCSVGRVALFPTGMVFERKDL